MDYYNNFYAITFGQKITANCAECTFINLGTATVTIDNTFPLVTGASLSLDGKAGERDVSTYTIGFGAGTQNCILVRKFYTGVSKDSYTILK